MQEKNKKYNEKEQQIAENRSRNTLFERRENLQKHESYASERRQYDAIRNGQTDRIQSIFQLTPDGTPGILSRNELRNSKNMFIAGITLQVLHRPLVTERVTRWISTTEERE